MHLSYIIFAVPMLMFIFIISQGWCADVGLSFLVYLNISSSIVATLIMQTLFILTAALAGCIVILPANILLVNFSTLLGFFIGSLTTICLIISTGLESAFLSQYIVLIASCTLTAQTVTRKTGSAL